MGSWRRQVARSAAPPGSPAAVALAGHAALAVAVGIGRFAFTPILPMMLEDAGVSIADGGWLAAANYAGYLLGALSALVLQVPAARTIRAGLCVVGLATLAMGGEHRFAAQVALRTVAGVASAWILVSVSAWALDRLARLGRPVLGTAVFAGVGTGSAAAGGACLLLMRLGGGSAHAWIALGLLALAATAAIWPAFGESPGASAVPEGSLAGPRRVTSDRIRLVLCYGAFGFGYIVPATFLPVMARQAVRDPSLFGWVWPIFGLAAAASTFAGALAGRLGGQRRLWAASQLVMALAVVAPVLRPGLSGVVLAALGVGGTFMVVTMSGMQTAREVAGDAAARLMAAMTTAFALGQIVGPVVVSAVGGGSSAPLLAAGALLLAGAGALVLGRSAGASSAIAPRAS